MDLNYIKKLVKLVAESGVSELEIEEEGKSIRISKNAHRSDAVYEPMALHGPTAGTLSGSPSTVSSAALPIPTESKSGKKHHEIMSPIVGTFYRSPAPDADEYVKVGQEVQQGTVLCIIEAMKLMNEIESDVAGRIVKINVENGQPVEYNQPLFTIELP